VAAALGCAITRLPSHMDAMAGQRSSNQQQYETEPADAATQGSARKPTRVESGIWGGDHIRLDVHENGGDVEFDCARGEVTGPLELNKKRRFDRPGTFVRTGPGPIRIGRSPGARPARYEGRISGKNMTVTVTLTETSQPIGTFTLTRGSKGRLWKCR
jgi:hypothetical protein